VTLIEVIVDKRDNHTFEVEMVVHAEHHDPFVGRLSSGDLYGCIDLVSEKVERQLRDFKERTRKHKGHTPTSGAFIGK
jgi:ribosomal subunit interface protein